MRKGSANQICPEGLYKCVGCRLSIDVIRSTGITNDWFYKSINFKQNRKLIIGVVKEAMFQAHLRGSYINNKYLYNVYWGKFELHNTIKKNIQFFIQKIRLHQR